MAKDEKHQFFRNQIRKVEGATLSGVRKLHFFVPLLILLLSRQHCRGYDEALYLMPTHAFDESLSSNWVAEVKASLPDKYSTNSNLDFQQVTNLLYQESLKGNISAQGLWGFTLIAASHSPEATEAGLQVLRDSANKGFVPAMPQLGSLYENGKYVRKNYNEAFRWYGQAAEKSDPIGQLKLGGCYQYGLGTTPNFSLAASYYLLSAQQTNYVAMKSLGYLLMNGLGVAKDLKSAKYWLSRAANEDGNRRAMHNLGVIYDLNYPDTNSMAKAFQLFKQSAELGDPLACYALANFYFNGYGAAETNRASFRYWRLRAAVLGCTEAQYQMGAAYRTGDGVPKDVETSLVWYQKAAAKNHPKAFYDLAVHYLEDRTNRTSMIKGYNYMTLAAQAGHREAQLLCAMSCFRGDIEPVNFEKGRQLLQDSAEADWARAESCLFRLYFNGEAPGSECPHYSKDRGKAIKWLQRAAYHKNLEAQRTLGFMLISGTGVEVNKVEAEKLFRDAAEHGYAPAQNDLGFAIENGDASSRDMVESAMWIRLAISQATDPSVLKPATVNLTNAMSRLTEDQQIEVERRVKNFQALPVEEIDPMPSGWEKNNTSYQQEDGLFGH